MADLMTDVANIQDEDQLRRMWSNTEDFAKKKEIRVRLYKLRESRLKLNYTNEDNNTSSYNKSSSNLIQETNRKHTATRTFDTIQDQGYMSLKSKEIRDSESPTRDIHGKIIRNDSYNNKSYDVKLLDNTVVLPNSQDWTTSQTANYSTNVEGNTVTESAERQSSAVLAKANENITLNAQENQTFSTTDNSKDGNIDKSTTLQESSDLVQNSSYEDDNTKVQSLSKQKQEGSVTSSVKQVGNVTSYSTSTRTVSSTSSSSKTVTSSSKSISSKGVAIESGDDHNDKVLSIQQGEIDDEVEPNLSYGSRRSSKVDRTVRKRSSTASLSDVIQKRNSLTSSQIHGVNESESHADSMDTTDIRSSRIIKDRSDSSSSIKSSKIIKNQNETSSKYETSKTFQDATDVDDYITQQNLKNSENNVIKTEAIDKNSIRATRNSVDNSRKLAENEKVTDSTRIDIVENDNFSTNDTSDVSDVKLFNSRKDIKTSHLSNVNTSQTVDSKNIDQNILTELSNLDCYLSTHPTSTPVSPRSAVTDTDYQDARRAPVKHPSTLDLPKECTEGQYVTTYSDSYKNRISTNYDVSPTHNAFASSLRADTPERSPSSPTRAFSTDRKSPRSSPEKYNTRSVSENRYRKSPEKTPTRDSPNRFSKESPERKPTRSSPDRYQARKSPEKTPTREFQSRKSPEKTFAQSSPNNTTLSPTKSPVDNKFGKQPARFSPTRKSPEQTNNNFNNSTGLTRAQERRLSSASYTVETKRDTSKNKRKFSSAQSKDAAKKRISTPKVSPDTSPTRDGNSSDSSNNTEGTYNKSTRKREDVTRSDSQDTYSITQNTFTKSTDYTRTDSHDTYNKDRKDSTETYDKDETGRNDSRNSYITDHEQETHEFERSDSTDSFNVKKLRKDSKDITKQDLKERKLFSESENHTEKTTKTDDFIRTEISENAQQKSYKSPSVSPVRQKSPEYSSEGSITKEIKLVNSLTDKSLTLIEKVEEIPSSASVSPCTSPDSYKTAPRRPSILKKKTTDSQITQESNMETQVTPQQSLFKTSSPKKSFVKSDEVQNKTERKSSILKNTSKEDTSDVKTTDLESSILKSPSKKEKSPDRNMDASHVFRDEFEISVIEQKRKSPTRVSAKQSSSPTESPRVSPTRRTSPIESRLTSPTQASLIREQNISETFDLTLKERQTPTKSPLRETAPRQPSPRKSPIRDTKSPEKTRRTPIREKASPQRVPSKTIEKRPSRKSSIPRAESLKTVNNKRPTSTTPSRQNSSIRVSPNTSAVSPAPKKTTSTPKVAPSKTPSQRSLTPQQSKSSIKTTPKVPVTTRTNSANLSKTSTLVKNNSYTSRRATEPVKQVKPYTPVSPTKISSKAPVKQTPKVFKQQSAKKLPVKSTKSTKELTSNKHTKTTMNIEEEIRASNKTLEDILSREQREYDSEIDSEVPPDEFLVEDDDFCEVTESRKERKSFFASKQDQIRKETVKQAESSSDEEIDNIKITKAEHVNEKMTNTQNEDLLSVVIQLPNSSRESTPGVKNTGVKPVPYTSDINQPARYADYYSEPDTDNERNVNSVKTSQYEQVTDLDEETIDLNVSVADRVNKFLNSSKSEQDNENTQTVIEKKSVFQAKNMFENIAKSQSSPNYEKGPKNYVKPLSAQQSVSEDLCRSKTYYEVNHTEKRTLNDFINVEKDTISQNEQVKKSPIDIYLEKTNHGSTTPQKPSKVSQPQKKVFDDTYYIEKNKRKTEDLEKTNRNKTTIDSCDEYIEIKEDYDVKKKSPKDIYLEKTQKSNSKTNVVETQKKTPDIEEEKKPQEKQFKRVPSTTVNNTKSRKNFFEEKINIEAEKSKSTLKTNKSADKISRIDKKSPVRQSPSRKSPENSEVKATSSRQSPSRKSPEKIKRKYDARKDSLIEIRGSNIIAERRTKFSPLKEHQNDVVGRPIQKNHVQKNVESKENVKPYEKKSNRRSAERTSEEKTTSKIVSTTVTQDKLVKVRKPSVERLQRKSSNKFEERRASFENRTVTERKVSSEIKQSERRVSADKTVTQTRKSVSKSPEPKAKDQSSPTRRLFNKTSQDVNAKPTPKQDSFNNKFGVELKKTSNTSRTTVSNKDNTINVQKTTNKNTTSTTDSIFDIESIFDLELLEKMLEKAVGYDHRRRLRAQIREVKKVQETSATRKSPSPGQKTNQKKSTIEEKQQKEFQSSTISSAAKIYQSSSPAQSSVTPTKKTSTGYEPVKPVAVPSQEKRNSYQRNDTTETMVQRRGSTEYSQTSTYTTSQVREETCTDSITSSYGVGPTDENGRPLFGLKALRRTNTNKALVDDDFTSSSSVQITEAESNELGGLRDSSGRPLFGGLRALKLADMPEQPPTSQLKDLVEKHEKSAHTSSHSTAVASRTSMKTDSSGRVTVTRDTMAGEISVKDNEEPKGKLTKSEFKFNKKSADDQGVSEQKTTTAILNGKNIKDSHISETLTLTDYNRTNNAIENEKKSSFRKTDSSSSFKENQESGSQKRKKSDSLTENKFSKTDSSSSFSSKQTVESSSSEKRSYRKKDSSSSVTRQDEEEDIEEEVRRKPVVRGDSVRALQSKFQQATVSSSMKNASPAASNESKAITSTNQSTKTVSSNGNTSTTSTKTSSTRTETFSTVIKGSSSFESDEEETEGEKGNFIEDDGFGNSSAALVSRIEKQRVASSTSDSRSDSRQKLDISDVDLISDESQLRILLEACSDYEGRRKIRARLRDVMAENNGASDTVASTNGNNVTKTEVRTRIVSLTATTHRLTKANSVQVPSAPASPFAKFKQLERQNSVPNSRTESPKLVRSASSIKETMLNWVKAQTAEYKNVQIDNFSTSWNDGMAFCALIHHFYPHAFDFDQLTPKARRHNFELAFRVAEEQADLMPLLDVEDMVVMKRPDWKCVFTYVQTFYRRFHSDPRAMKVY